jgi:hypothetical protein
MIIRTDKSDGKLRTPSVYLHRLANGEIQDEGFKLIENTDGKLYFSYEGENYLCRTNKYKMPSGYRGWVIIVPVNEVSENGDRS